MLFRFMTAVASMVYTETPWWVGVPTKLLKKQTLVKADPKVGRLAVHTLTFEIPPKNATFTGRAKSPSEIRIDLGDVVKMVIPNYKPKSYSVSALRENEFDVTFKAYNGRASGYLDRLKVGDVTNTFGLSAGRIRNPGKNVGIIAYGVGITEALPVAQAELEKYDDANEVVLLWASRTSDDTFWHDGIEKLKAKYPTKFKVVHILSREDRRDEGALYGRITPDILKQVFQPTNRNEARFLSVGTKAMMRMTDDMLSEIGYDMPRNALLPKLR